ncbi:MAG: hypothetical protein EXS16_03335 [Gemmataceae bacterium]|nr:hypothetical protein [Gemmataceae bacterium]
MPKVCIPLFLLLSLLPLACAGNTDGRRALSGTVVLNGEPLDHGAIKFQATDPSQKYETGAMIELGKFNIPAEFGLTPGVYKVTITSQEIDKNVAPPVAKGPGGTPPPAMHERIPPDYNSQSSRTIEVKAAPEANKFDFDIK